VGCLCLRNPHPLEDSAPRVQRGFLCRETLPIVWSFSSALSLSAVRHCLRAHRHSGRLHNLADNEAIAEHVVVVVTPLAGWAARRCPLEDQLGQPPSPFTLRVRNTGRSGRKVRNTSRNVDPMNL
jgi:hypothetical protein